MEHKDYTLNISPNILKHLGIQLYDTISAVLSEFISNSYDADAYNIEIIVEKDGLSDESIFGNFLSTQKGEDLGYRIIIKDDGHGMNPKELQEKFLLVGGCKRDDGDTSPKGRKVTGNKGVGKLAPFGICGRIEVISSGGAKQNNGYATGHIILEKNKILNAKTGDTYRPLKGKEDQTFLESTGTTIVLSDFSYKKLPTKEMLSRQIASKYNLKDWRSEGIIIKLGNTQIDDVSIQTKDNCRIEIGEPTRWLHNNKEIQEIENKINVDGKPYPIKGWFGYSKRPNNDTFLSGIRILCRGKLATRTTDFNMSGSYYGQFNIKSYLVGVLHCDWLDEDEDWIITNRTDISWSNNVCEVFQNWGQRLVKYAAKNLIEKVREDNSKDFCNLELVKNSIEEKFPKDKNLEMHKRAFDLAKILSRDVSKKEYDDTERVRQIVDLATLFAPNLELDEALINIVDDSSDDISKVNELLKKAKIAELSSYGNIAKKRVEVITKLETLTTQNTTERELQEELENSIKDAPWIWHPEWSPIAQNQSLKTFKEQLESFFKSQSITPTKDFPSDLLNKRPDFVFYSSQSNTVEIIEIKRALSEFKNEDYDRLRNYVEAFDFFLKSEQELSYEEYKITLVSKSINITNRDKRDGFESLQRKEIIHHFTWLDFIAKAKRHNREYYDEFKAKYQSNEA